MPRKKLDLKQVELLAQIGATHDEIAVVMMMSPATFGRRMEDPKVREAWETGRAKLRLSLRRQQIKAAEEGNPAMLIWLGKQLLGQREYQRVEVSGPDKGPIEIRDDNTAAGRILSALALIAERRAAATGAQPVESGANGSAGIRLERILEQTKSTIT